VTRHLATQIGDNRFTMAAVTTTNHKNKLREDFELQVKMTTTTQTYETHTLVIQTHTQKKNVVEL